MYNQRGMGLRGNDTLDGKAVSSCAIVFIQSQKESSANFAGTAFPEVCHPQANAQTTRKIVHLGNVSSTRCLLYWADNHSNSE
jgi:hypothetical protein